MISSSYNIKEFFEEVQDKDLHEIIVLTDREFATAESVAKDKYRRPETRQHPSVRYQYLLQGFRALMMMGLRPGGYSDDDLLLFQPVCDNLVEKKVFKPSILELFEGLTEPGS